MRSTSLRSTSTVVVLWALAGLGALAPRVALAQGASSASVSGTVTSTTGEAVRGALVTLSTVGGSASHETTTDGSGSYGFALVAPGSYELRAEALGYRPVLARTLVLSGGDRGRVPLTLSPAPPPVLTIDTVALGGVGSSRWQPGGTSVGAAEIASLPFRDEDPSAIAALSSSLDPSLGAEGLPGSMTLLVADGIPVWRAPHPLARAERLSFAAFPRSALGGLSVRSNAQDVQAGGSAGAYALLTTRAGSSGGGPELEGAWSGAPLWSSSELDISTPSLTSFQGAASATIEVTPGASQLFVSADAFGHEAPLGPRVGDVGAPTLAGLDTDLIDRLSSPSVERFQRFSTLARFDAQRGTSSQIFFRGAVGYARREFDGPGPLTVARDAALPEEGVDYSVAAGFISQSRPGGRVFEIRGGVSGSSRTFEPASEANPSATLVETGSMLGMAFGGAGESSRWDVVMVPTLQYGLWGGRLEFGLPLRVSGHTISRSGPGAFFHSDGAALVAGQGYAQALSAPAASFSTREMGLFAQYEAEPSPGLGVSLGVRLDYESIPGSEATLSTAWLQATGLRNDDYPSSFGQMGARASFTWDPSRDGSTLLFGALTVHHGDIDTGVLGELFSHDGPATSTHYAGAGFAWPMSGLPGAAIPRTTLTLLGPDTRAPRSARGSAGVVQGLGGGFSVHLGGAYRRTDFLVRRRNLNLPVLPQAVDAYGRDVFGTLTKDGALVTATDPDARRFSAFNEVWALDPDGWSKHAEGTVGLQYAGASTSLAVSYTRSKTTDNWTGASQAHAQAELSPRLPQNGENWSDGTSDFDVPDRIAASATTGLGPVTLSAVYRYRSGLPFTPRYRPGVDANGDGSYRNDVAYVDAALVDPLLSDWPCLADDSGGFASRNSCRGPAVHSVDVRVRFRLGRLMGRDASLVLDGFNLVEGTDGMIDDALLLVDPAAALGGTGGTVTIPVIANPGFGQVLYPSTRGRMLRVGFRIG